MLIHHVWAQGLVLVAEGPDQAWAAAFGPWGWHAGTPQAILPDGPPEGAETTRLEIPAWLAGALPTLEFLHGGLHTDFVRLDRLVARMQADGRGGAVFVIGSASRALVLSGRGPLVVVPTGGPPPPSEAVFAGASGWIVAFSGQVAVPTGQARVIEPPAAAARVPVAARAEARTSGAPAGEVRTPDPAPAEGRTSVPPPGEVQAASGVRRAAGERFIAASGEIPDEVAAEIRAMVGDAGLPVPPLLDGTRTVTELAAQTGLREDQVTAVVKVLVGAKLAFRYVARVRPTTGTRSSG